MRTIICIALIIAALAIGPVSADRIIFAPTGSTLAAGEVKAEAATSPSNDDSKIYWVGLGLQKFELNAIRFDFKNTTATEDVDVINAQLSLVPETTLTPGISVGAWDISDKTADGTGYFLALSKAVPLTNELPLPISDVKVHAGFGINGIDGIFGGAEASLPLGLKISAEYFQKDLNYAIGWGPVSGLQVKAYILDGETYYGMKFSSPL